MNIMIVGMVQEQYVSVIIKDGRIVFQIGYTKDNILEIRSSSRYTTGNWTYLEATRYYDRKKKIEKGKRVRVRYESV